MKTNILISTTIFAAMLNNLIAVPAYTWQAVDDITKMANPANQADVPQSEKNYDAYGKSVSTGQTKQPPAKAGGFE